MARVDLGVVAMRGTPHSPKLQHYWSPTIGWFDVISMALVGGGSYPSAEMQSVYSAVPVDWASVTQCVIGKSHRWTCNVFWFRNVWVTSLNWAIALRKQPKTFVVPKVRIKALIPRPCSKRQIWWVALEDYWVRSAKEINRDKNFNIRKV